MQYKGINVSIPSVECMDFDIAMPLTLFTVTLVSLYANQKTENRLKENMQERQMGVRDAVLLVGFMAVTLYLIVVFREITLVLTAMFLFAYSMLLFTFTYLFSKNRWYVGVLPPAVFILLYVFVRDTPLWTLYLINMYGLVFAVLITLYLVSLFTWKTTAVFGVLITIMDIILVLVTGTMVKAVEVTRGLRLPVMVWLPRIPLATFEGTLLPTGLGLGDFFFAGLLTIQTFKKYGKRFALVSAVAMTLSFFVFQVMLLNYLQIPFAGTLMIISGWAPLVIWKQLTQKKPPASEVGTKVADRKTVV